MTEPFDHEARGREIAIAVDRVREARAPLSKLRRRRGKDRTEQFAAAIREWREARAGAYPGGFWEDYERLRNGDPSGAESAIRFLEADPWFTHAGFTKTRLLRRLKQVALGEDQRDRLRQVMIQAVRSRPRMEFTDYCRFARKIYSSDLRAQLELLCDEADRTVRTQAGKMLYFCEHGCWPSNAPWHHHGRPDGQSGFQHGLSEDG
jgi:hypothetical protein